MGRTRVGGLYVWAVVNVMSEALTYMRAVTPPPHGAQEAYSPNPAPFALLMSA